MVDPHPTTRRPDDVCPYCGALNDAATGVNAERPSSGDVGVCWYCAGLLILEEHGVRLPTDTERAECMKDPLVSTAVGFVLAERVGDGRGTDDQ